MQIFLLDNYILKKPFLGGNLYRPFPYFPSLHVFVTE